MNKLLITCTNNAHTGKTTALWHVYRLLKLKYPIVEVQSPLDDEQPCDVRAVFNIGGIHVGLETMGDNPDAKKHRESLWRFVEEQNCSIVIAASRMRCETRDNIEDFIDEFRYDAVWMSHDYTRIERLQQELNIRYAERVVRYIEERAAWGSN